MKLFIPTPHELAQIKAGTLKAFVRPVVPQPILRNVQDECSRREKMCHECDNLECSDNLALGCPPHQPGDVLAVAEEWQWWEVHRQGSVCAADVVVGGEDRLVDIPVELMATLWREVREPRYQPAKTMPPELAHYHLTISDVGAVKQDDNWIWCYQCEVKEKA